MSIVYCDEHDHMVDTDLEHFEDVRRKYESLNKGCYIMRKVTRK